MLADKTGSLIATSARLGAMLSGAPAGVAEVLTAYGERIGVAFQLSDDLLDIASESAESGKMPGTDLREGVRTLPVLLVLAGDDPAEARLRELLAAPLTDDADLAEALALLRSSPSMAAARTEMTRWAEAARGGARAAAAGRVRPGGRGGDVRPVGPLRRRHDPYGIGRGAVRSPRRRPARGGSGGPRRW